MGKELPVWAFILLIAFITGALVAVGLKTGTPTDGNEISIFFLKTICKVTQDIDNKLIYSCNSFLAGMILLSIFGAVVTIIEEAARIGNFWFGLFFYIVGWIGGLIYMLRHLT